jgi:hypothetical protein
VNKTVEFDPGRRIAMSIENSDSDRASTASELRKMSPAERDEVLASAARRAEGEYRSNPDLTDFEAFSENDWIRDHTAFSNSYAAQDEGLYDD